MNVELAFYQDGIMRVLIDENDPGVKRRFRASEHMGVEEAQLVPVRHIESHVRYSEDGAILTLSSLNSDDMIDSFEFRINLTSFSIEQYANDTLVLATNTF